MEKQLSIVIPTYNRKERLLNQLRSIFKQQKYFFTSIIILDNCSSYTIEQELNNNFSKQELSHVEVIQRVYNIGMASNISSSFMNCKTKWMWLLSDDDETEIEALDIILDNIRRNPDVAVFKYSIGGEKLIFVPEEDKTISSIDEYIEYYKMGVHTSGNMIFMSNNIFNLEVLKPYLGYANIYSYTYIPHLIPLIAGLAEKKVKLKLCSKAIIKYLHPVAGSEWNFITTILGLSSFADINQNITLSNKQQNELSGLVVRDFSHIKFLECLFLIKDRKARKYFYEKVFKSLYIHTNISKWRYYLIFFIMYYLNINIISMGKKIRKILK